MPRGRPPLIHPNVPKEISFDAALITRLDLILYSDVEGRVPKGAYQRFFNTLLAQYFEHKTLDLSPYLGTLPGEATVRGAEATIKRLEAALQQKEFTK